MASQHKLDIALGAARRAWVEAQAQASGRSLADVVNATIDEAMLADSERKDAVRRAVLDLAHAVEPDERYDPADDPREAEAVSRLAALLGSAPAAEGIAEALAALWAEQNLKEDTNV